MSSLAAINHCLRAMNLAQRTGRSESSKDFGEMSVGFTFKDFAALYGNKYKSLNNFNTFPSPTQVSLFNNFNYPFFRFLI